MSWKSPFLLIRDAVNASFADNVPMLSAGIAFYTLVSFAPTVVIAIAVAGAVLGPDAVRGDLFHQLREVMGPEAAAVTQQMVARTSSAGDNLAATVVSLGVLLFGSARLFIALRVTLNTIWGVQVRTDWGMMGMLKDRVVVFLMVLGTGILLLLSIFVSALLAALTGFFEEYIPGGGILWRVLDIAMNFGLSVIIFMLILQLVPDVNLAWRDVLIGAVVTAALFALGRYAIGMYLGRSSFTSVYGAAGSLVVLLFWAYYTAQILCLGAEFTKVYVRRRGGRVSLRQRVVYEHAHERGAGAAGPPDG